MMVKNILGSLVVLSSISFASDYYVQTNVGYYDGKAKSTSNSADDRTVVPSIELGIKYSNFNLYLSYDQIKWSDAKAQDAMVNVDYVIPTGSVEYFIGVGAGKMKYEVDDISSKAKTRAVGSVKAGINYELTKSFYVSSSVRYLYTNELEVSDTNAYSTLDNMLGVQVGVGYKF